MRISDWSSDVCSSDLKGALGRFLQEGSEPHSLHLTECLVEIADLERNQKDTFAFFIDELGDGGVGLCRGDQVQVKTNDVAAGSLQTGAGKFFRADELAGGAKNLLIFGARGVQIATGNIARTIPHLHSGHQYA